MTKDLALKALDASFQSGVGRMGDMFVSGLIAGEEVEAISTRFRTGLKAHVDAHERATAVIEAYFKDSQ
jgi:hypothetical protein